MTTPDTTRWSGFQIAAGIERGVALVLLACSAALSCVLASAWLTMWIGAIPAPFTVLGAGLWSMLLVRVARQWTSNSLVAAIPALVWIVTLFVLGAGPGDDMPVPIGLRSLALLVAGGLLPLWFAFYGPGRSERSAKP